MKTFKLTEEVLLASAAVVKTVGYGDKKEQVLVLAYSDSDKFWKAMSKAAGTMAEFIPEYHSGWALMLPKGWDSFIILDYDGTPNLSIDSLMNAECSISLLENALGDLCNITIIF